MLGDINEKCPGSRQKRRQKNIRTNARKNVTLNTNNTEIEDVTELCCVVHFYKKDLCITFAGKISSNNSNVACSYCLHLQLYRDSKDRYKHGQTKASLSLEHFLGVESGFTLDKESNTIAIICQDVIVVLAFDTRERLMQWQVKIANHLGDDIQYLVLVSSAPPKSKMQTGPSRMHIQDNRFCLTTGVPPKLAGLWDIGYLRRYGVVDNRFCFEGGSRCGKGEGLYVFITDQGDDITQTLKLASQGRLSTKKRQMARKLAIDSPRKILSPRPLDGIDDNFSCHIDDSSNCTCGSRTPYWPSQESRDIDYGCGDTNSVSECHDSFNDAEMFPKTGKAIERCMSCISKLGAPSMSRSSTATGNATPGGNQQPLWQILTEQNNQNNLTVKTIATINTNSALVSGNNTSNISTVNVVNGVDRMSICSSHGSSGGYGSSGGSEYSVPRMTTNLTASTYAESSYESIPANQFCSNNHLSCQNCPPSKGLLNSNCNKGQNQKPPMPLPIVNPLHTHHTIMSLQQQQQHQKCITTQPTNINHIGPYENYDIPKSTNLNSTNSVNSLTGGQISAAENYDTPKNIQEYLNEDMNSNSQIQQQSSLVCDGPDKYGNYDMPAQMCGCLGSTNSNNQTNPSSNNGTLKANKESGNSITDGVSSGRADCACNRVMSWADNWISIPYCRRGNGIEQTGVPINRVKLSGEGKMPVMQPSGELAIYAQVDFSKKSNRQGSTSDHVCNCPKENSNGCAMDDGSSETSSSNYINLDPGHVLPELVTTAIAAVNKKASDSVEIKTELSNNVANYTNLDFAHSLENYENSKEMLQKAGITLQEIEQLRMRENQDFCQKCGHSAKTPDPKQDKTPTGFESSSQLHTPSTIDSSEGTASLQIEYLKLDPDKNDTSTKFPGYLPMSPAPSAAAALNAQSTTSGNTNSNNNNSNNSGNCGNNTGCTMAPPLPSKSELLKRIIGEKSASNPTLSGPTVDRSRKRNDPNRIPGSAMMLLHRTGSSPYNRKQIMDSSDLLPSIDKRLASRKRSSSADSSRFLEDVEDFDSSETLRKSSLTQINSGRRSSSPCLHQEMEQCVEQVCFPPQTSKPNATETEDETSVTSTSTSQVSQSVHIRRSASVPCKAQNRDSSSSNDSGVSTGSLRHRVGDFHDFELPLTTAMSARRHQRQVQPVSACVHATLPRRSKSFDPLREISFQFQKVEIPGKSTSAEAEVPVLSAKQRGYGSPCEGNSTAAPPYVDSRSTSSGTSDMSDYIETLSLSSHSSSDAPENLRLLRQATSTLRPRSGKEYQNIDRSLIALTQAGDTVKVHTNQAAQIRGLLSCTVNYANITPVPENAESPSPGYQSGYSPQESQADSFVYNQIQSKQ
ncbi:uncharacterized protein LOC129612705 [Condylostylus longicornis]|uniref:uncharacterized protein LOC129612705 n=1 Tax=Condylostylus longicornis TaxID=2530218 RepID=UPI00244E36B4|nr:uncharacterized protein LOC129612705 [Condylostylus longicornis]